MRKAIYFGIIIFGFFILSTTTSNAVEAPYYDKAYNNNSGAFYANGTDITIEEYSGQNLIKWSGGQQVVPISVTVFGGGQQGKTFDKSNITMDSGNVVAVVGGGISTNQNSISSVNDANITINGGTIQDNVVGGGYLYAEVGNSTITINNGTAEAIIGGGLATLMLDGQTRHVGTSTNPQDSPNRVNNVSITINDVTMPLPSHLGGIIYAGAQGYAYVGDTSLTINGGNMSKTTVTAGGSDDYVRKSNINITGGAIRLYQSVNRGTIEEVTAKVTGGNIEEFVIGAKQGGLSTGKINRSSTYLLDGILGSLEAGVTNSVPLIIDNVNHKVIQTEDVTISKNSIPEEQTTLVYYYLTLYPTELTLSKGETKGINLSVSTMPEGYEDLFIDNARWGSNNTSVATVSQDGTVTAVESGTAEISASYLKKTKDVSIIVKNEDRNPVIPRIAIFPLLLLFILFLFIVFLLSFLPII